MNRPGRCLPLVTLCLSTYLATQKHCSRSTTILACDDRFINIRGEASTKASISRSLGYRSVMSSRWMHTPVLTQPSQCRHPRIFSVQAITFSVSAPAAAAPASTRSTNVSVLPPRRGLPARARTFKMTPRETGFAGRVIWPATWSAPTVWDDGPTREPRYPALRLRRAGPGGRHIPLPGGGGVRPHRRQAFGTALGRPVRLHRPRS